MKNRKAASKTKSKKDGRKALVSSKTTKNARLKENGEKNYSPHDSCKLAHYHMWLPPFIESI